MRIMVAIFLVLVSGAAMAQAPENDLLDPLNLAQLKNYTAGRSTSSSRDIVSNEDSKRILPGETLVIADLTGPGMVSHIWFTGSANEFASPRLMRLRVYYDGKKTPSVDAPMGDFFGVGNGDQVDLNSAMIRNTAEGRARNSYWPMPFRKSCKITMTNEGTLLKTLYYHIDWRKYPSLPADIGYFHAYYRQEHPAAPDRHYAFLNIRGRGHYVGTVLNILQSQISWFGEGDDQFYVDGATKPQILGTGAEDYLNQAWGLRKMDGPWFGSPVVEGFHVGSRLSSYRWHVPDPIPFTQSLWAGIEHYGWTYSAERTPPTSIRERDDYYSSVAFWYQEGVNEGLPEPPFGDERLPLGNAQVIKIEESIKDVTVEKGKAAVQMGAEWGKNLVTFNADGIGSRINIPIDIPETGRYELLAHIAVAPDYGNYVALVDNQPANLDPDAPASTEIPNPAQTVYHNYQLEAQLAIQRPLGWYAFNKGRHVLSLICVGKDYDATAYNVGVWNVILEKVPAKAGDSQPMSVHKMPPPQAEAPPLAPSGTPVYRGLTLSACIERLKIAPKADRPGVVRALGSFGADAAAAVPQLGEALGDSDPQLRLAAAWAFSQVGASGIAAAPALGKALSDSDPRVRILAALALKAMGPAASPAVPDLMRALKDSSEYVRSASATALGMMGPAAYVAIGPLMERLTKDEDGLVASEAAAALGNMGPAAKEALPALEKAVQDRRVGATGEEAILKVQGKPVPTWN
jgi:HEAT repeat protein